MSRHFFFPATLRFQPSKCALRLEMSYFRVLATAETLLLPFFVRPPRRKCSFCCFIAFSRGGNAVFLIFYFSAAAESHFSAFSHFHPWMTDGFLCFSRFVGRRRAYFRNFCVSSADDERFSAIFAFRRPTTGVFLHFSRFVG